LENLLERVVLLEDGPELRAYHLPPEMHRGSERLPAGASAESAGEVCGEATLWGRFVQHLDALSEGRVLRLRALEDAYIDLVLEVCGGNRSRTSRLLGLSRQGLIDRLRRIHEKRIRADLAPGVSRGEHRHAQRAASGSENPADIDRERQQI
jgi:DNA-binding NtrC family response regulator